MTLPSMAATQTTTATTLNPSPDRKQAAGRDTKWKWKLGEPTPTPLRSKRSFSRGVVFAPEQSVSVLVGISIVHSSDLSGNDLSVACTFKSVENIFGSVIQLMIKGGTDSTG